MFRIGLASLGLALGLALPTPAGGQGLDSPTGPIEIVLDASGSMRGRMGDATKMDVARAFVQELRRELETEPSRTVLGLRVYGSQTHRLRRDCQDTRLLIELGDLTPWDEVLEAVRPLGVSPLALALESAARDTATTYVLVTDGDDNCGRNACETWREIVGVQGNRRARLHVVALNPETEDVDRLRCLSRAGSGTFLTVSNPDSTAVVARRLGLVLRNRGVLDVRVSIGDVERFAVPVRVMRPLTREVVAVFSSREPEELPAGAYSVVVETTPRVSIGRVLVIPGQTVTIERTDFGRLEVDVRDRENQPLRFPVSVRSASGGPELRFLSTGEPTILMSGSYQVRVDMGDSVVLEQVKVESGERAEVVLGGTGTLRVEAPGFVEVPPTRALVYRDRDTQPDTLAVGTRESLPAGRYRLIVQTLPIYVGAEVVIRGASEATISLPETGILRVDVEGVDGPVEGQEIDVREPLTDERYGTLRSGERRLVMPGTYRLELLSIPPRTLEDIVVRSGEERGVSVSGMSRVEVEGPTIEGGYRLELLTPIGDRSLGEITGERPAVDVWPGVYLIRVWNGTDLLWESSVSVASGKTARIDLRSRPHDPG